MNNEYYMSRWWGEKHTVECVWSMIEEGADCVCYLCEACGVPMNVEALIKISPGEFECQDCVIEEMNGLRRRFE